MSVSAGAPLSVAVSVSVTVSVSAFKAVAVAVPVHPLCTAVRVSVCADDCVHGMCVPWVKGRARHICTCTRAFIFVRALSESFL